MSGAAQIQEGKAPSDRARGGGSESGEVRKPHIAFVVNTLTPYRVQSHLRVRREIPGFDVRTYVHWDMGQNLWVYDDVPEIGVRSFPGVASEKQMGTLDYYRREWRTGGLIIEQLIKDPPAALLVCGYATPSTFRVIKWASGRIPLMIWGDSNIHGDTVTGYKRLIKDRLVRWAVSKADAIMPCGVNGKKFFARYGCPAQKMFAFPVEPDYEMIEKCPKETIDAARERWKIDPARKRLLVCGRFISVKGIDVGIDAFVAIADRRPDWDLFIVGDGPLRKFLEARVPARLKHRVTCAGFIDKQDVVNAIYHQCEVLVHPSNKDAWGVVLLEASAAGLAIVTTPVVGASPEFVADHESGRLFTAGDRKGLTDALMEVTDPANTARFKAASKALSDRFRRESDPVANMKRALEFIGVRG
jgi:glycosyltransferase involved in cell wall biosynthesis